MNEWLFNDIFGTQRPYWCPEEQTVICELIKTDEMSYLKPIDMRMRVMTPTILAKEPL